MDVRTIIGTAIAGLMLNAGDVLGQGDRDKELKLSKGLEPTAFADPAVIQSNFGDYKNIRIMDLKGNKSVWLLVDNTKGIDPNAAEPVEVVSTMTEIKNPETGVKERYEEGGYKYSLGIMPPHHVIIDPNEAEPRYVPTTASEARKVANAALYGSSSKGPKF